MNCIHCHGQVKHSQAPFHVDRKGYHLVLDPVPAWVCGQCGEAYFEEREVAAIQSTVNQLIGKYDRQNRLVGVEAVEHISLLDPLDVPARLDEFRDMKDGWLKGEGVAPSMNGLDWLAATFDRHFPDDLPLPYLYPTPEGGVEAEWPLGSQSVIFEIDLETHRGDWLCFDKQSDSEDTRLLNLDAADSWAWLVAEVRRLKEEGK